MEPGKQLPDGTEPASVETQVFIPLDKTVQLLRHIIQQQGAVTFVRGPVACGKSTLANYLTTHIKDEFVRLIVFATDSEEMIKKKLLDLAELKESDVLENALRKLSAKTLVVDEGHLLLSHQNLVSDLFKVRKQNECPKILLFSAVASGIINGGEVTTPATIRKKFMWYPPIPDAKYLAQDLQNATVFLSADSVNFFMRLCCGHRGIFMCAMEWVRDRQESDFKNRPDKKTGRRTWSIQDSVKFVRKSFEESEAYNNWGHGLKEYLQKSRAVRAEGAYETLSNIPIVFAEVLFGGSKRKNELGGLERQLTVAGFLVPEREETDGEFVMYDWSDTSKLYGVATSMMAQYYIENLNPLGYKSQLSAMKVTCGADMLARALPLMSFSYVVGNPFPDSRGTLQSTLACTGLPYEDDYNRALVAALKKLGYSVSEPFSPTKGKVDVIVTLGHSETCAIESIMEYQGEESHAQHCKRFSQYQNYMQANVKVLLVIGDSLQHLKKKTQSIPEEVRKGIEVVLVVVSQSHDSYEMHLMRPDRQFDGPFLFLCDGVSKTLIKKKGKIFIQSAQQLLKVGEVPDMRFRFCRPDLELMSDVEFQHAIDNTKMIKLCSNPLIQEGGLRAQAPRGVQDGTYEPVFQHVNNKTGYCYRAMKKAELENLTVQKFYNDIFNKHELGKVDPITIHIGFQAIAQDHSADF